MNKHVFIINGAGSFGKDTFVKLVRTELNDIFKRFDTVDNYSSIDKIKKVAYEFGYSGGKTDKDRKFLSDLKHLVGNYSDMPFICMRKRVNEFYNNNKNFLLFLHIREPEEIQRAAKEFSAKTILIKNDKVKHIVSNLSDKNVFNYKYDYIIKNNGSIEDLDEKAKKFIGGLINEEGR